MSELALQAVSEGPLFRVDARFGAGTAVVLGSDAAALATLVAVAAGIRAPRSGRVLFDGSPLHASPELRRATGALLPVEAVPGFRRVSDGVELVLAARGERRSAQAFLDELALGAWAGRHARDLDASEARTLALALALGHMGPRLLVLYEPFAAGRALGAGFVKERIARATAAGAVVLVATQSLDDARSLGAVPFVLANGTLTSVFEVPQGAAAAEQTLVVETSDARRLAAGLARDPAVRGVRWNEELSPGTVLVYGADIEAVASAVARALVEESLGVRSVKLAPLPLDLLIAAPQAASFGYSYAGPPAYGGVPAPYPMGATPADQAVAMPTAFADPTRPRQGDGS